MNQEQMLTPTGTLVAQSSVVYLDFARLADAMIREAIMDAAAIYRRGRAARKRGMPSAADDAVALRNLLAWIDGAPAPITIDEACGALGMDPRAVADAVRRSLATGHGLFHRREQASNAKMRVGQRGSKGSRS